ncbi:MAG: hypothetical protein ACTHKG_19655 [Nocardioides sp.]
MSTSWVAGVVRAKALARRRVGAAGARSVAAKAGLADAVATLAGTPYGHDVQPGQSLEQAQHAAAATLLWNMRVLAGWLPWPGADVVRLLAAAFELANVDEHLALLDGDPPGPTYALGTLDTAWTRVAATTSLDAAASVLGTSPWRLREVRTRRDLVLGLRLAWADAVVAGIPQAAPWARAAAALVVLREVLLEQRPLPAVLQQRAGYVLGPAFVTALTGPSPDLAAVRRGLPGDATWVLDGVDDAGGLWRAEVAWWQRVERDGFGLLRGSGYDQGPGVGAAAVLGVDAWRVRAALETAARGGSGAEMEVFDALA